MLIVTVVFGLIMTAGWESIPGYGELDELGGLVLVLGLRRRLNTAPIHGDFVRIPDLTCHRDSHVVGAVRERLSYRPNSVVQFRNAGVAVYNVHFPHNKIFIYKRNQDAGGEQGSVKADLRSHFDQVILT